MYKIYKILLLVVIAITFTTIATAQVNSDSVAVLQVASDTIPTSINPELENIFNAKMSVDRVGNRSSH